MAVPNFYQAYGLRIQSTLRLPELIAADPTPTPDLSIHQGPIRCQLPPDSQVQPRTILPSEDAITIYWPGVGTFLLEDGRYMTVDSLPDTPAHMVRLFILGTSLALLLHQRKDVTVIHASVASINGQAIAFVGPKGAGKSTMVALLHQHGHALLSDDLLVARMDSNTPQALPGFPHLKLWPDTAELVGQAASTLPRLRPELDKRGQRLNSDFRLEPVPLAAICILAEGESVALRPLPAHTGCLALLPHWYGARFGHDLLSLLGTARHFQECAALANRVPILVLERPHDLSRAPDTIHLLREWDKWV
jgi:hypothetical protein